MARPRERIDVAVLAPAEWVVGWLKGGFVIAGFIAFVLLIGAGYDPFSWRVVLGVAALVGLLPLYMWPAKVSLLEDGIAFKRYGLTRFIAYSAIARTEMIQRIGASWRREGEVVSATRGKWTVYTALRIHLRSGSKMDIATSCEEVEIKDTRQNISMGATGRFGTFNRKTWQLGRDVDDRVRDLQTEAPPTGALATSLLRGEQSIEEWRSAIDAAAPALGDAYRGGEGRQEALWRLVEDEAVPREARAGAALALRRSLDDDGRARIRVAIEGCESPKLRVALETAADADADDDRLAEALREASLPRQE